jgi:hypothetical protein
MRFKTLFIGNLFEVGIAERILTKKLKSQVKEQARSQ